MISKRTRRLLLVLAAMVLAPLPTSSAAHGASISIPVDPLESCPSFASSQRGYVGSALPGYAIPGLVTMADGSSRPVGDIDDGAFPGPWKGSSSLTWSPDGTALAYAQVTQQTLFEETAVSMVGNWDGSAPTPLPGVFSVWSPASDRLAAWSHDDAGYHLHIVRRGPAGWTSIPGPDGVWALAWTPDGSLLVWSGVGGDLWVGDADGRGARRIGQKSEYGATFVFMPGTHLLRNDGQWLDLDTGEPVGVAPEGLLSHTGEWAAWAAPSTDGESHSLLVSRNGEPPVAIWSAFGISPGAWSPDDRYLVSEVNDLAADGSVWVISTMLFDTVSGTTSILGPPVQVTVDDRTYPWIFEQFEWAPDSSAFFATNLYLALGIRAGAIYRYGVDGSIETVVAHGLAVGAMFWPRSTPVTHLDLSAHLGAVDTDESTQLHVRVTNDGPCDAADVVIDIATPAGSPGVSVQRSAQTIDVGLVRRGEVVDRVFDVMPSRDLPLTIAVATSTDDEGRSAGPLTLTMADVPAAPPGPPVAPAAGPVAPQGPPVTPAAGPVAVAVPARPTFAG